MSSDYGNGTGREGGHRMSDLISREAAMDAVTYMPDRWRKVAVDTLRALPAVHIHTTEAAPAVKVKPLVWVQIDDDDCDFEAYAMGFRYWVVKGSMATEAYRGLQGIGSFGDPEAAKSAAQADYERRILSAIEVHP